MPGEMEYRIRPYENADAEALTEICLAAIQAIGATRYSPKQIEVWSGRHPGPSLYRGRVNRGATIFVAIDESDAPVAYALLERDGHLDRLYCRPDHTGCGLAERLLAAAEDKARSWDIPRLYTEASELAHKAFARAGYAITHRRDFEIDGVAIHNYAMEKLLA